MTLNEITTLLGTNLRKELDMPFKFQMAERVKYWRSRLIENSVDKDHRERKWFKQSIWLPMAEIDSVPACAGFQGCKVAATTVDVPKSLRANNIMFDYVGSVDGMTAFQETAPAMLVYMSHGKYSKNRIWWALENSRIIEYGNPKLPMIRVDGIFDDPIAAGKLSCKPDDGTKCDSWDKEFPATNGIIQLIVQSILTVDYHQPITPVDKEVPVSPEEVPQ